MFSVSNFCVEIKNQFGTYARVLRSDNAKEYLSLLFCTFSRCGIVHQSLCPYTQYNTIVESKNRQLLNIVKLN